MPTSYLIFLSQKITLHGCMYFLGQHSQRLRACLPGYFQQDAPELYKNVAKLWITNDYYLFTTVSI